MNTNLIATSYSQGLSQIDSNALVATAQISNITSSLSTINDFFNSLKKNLYEANKQLGILMNKISVVTPFKIEKFSQLKGRSFDQANNLEYINFPFAQSFDCKWVQKVDQAIGSGSFINKVAEGISTTYLIHDASGKKIALFKPDDEASPYPTLDSAQSALREHLAWTLGKDLVNMPAAHVVEINVNGKATLGSLQQFIDSEGNLQHVLENHRSMKQLRENIQKIRLPWVSEGQHFQDVMAELTIGARKLGNELFNDYPSQVRGIALLDILIQNMDRSNPQNTLIKQDECGYKMIPIDHNLAFSKDIIPLAGLTMMPWYTSEAVRQPFNKKEVQWLNDLDIEAMKKTFSDKGLDAKRVNAFGIMAELVQTSARAGLTLFDIATLLMQPFSTNTFPFHSKMQQILTSQKSEGTVSEAVRKQIFDMVMEKRDQIMQFGMTDEVAFQLVFDELQDKSAFWDLLTSVNQDTSSALSKTRQAAFDRYIARGECPKEYLDVRFNSSRTTQPLNVIL